MKHVWTLPAVLRLALAGQHAFSVVDDLLAYPQYKIEISDSFVTEQFAEDRLAEAREQVSTSSAPASTGQDLSKPSDRATSQGQSGASKEGGGEEELENTYEELKLHGDRFLCRIPIVVPEEETEPALNETEKALQAEAEAKELARATDRGWELLQGMSDNCIYFMSGWWSYSFCYNDQITQFHPLPGGRGGVPAFPPTPDPNEGYYTLGMFPDSQDMSRTLDGNQADDREDASISPAKSEERGLAKLETRGETRYLVQNLGGGTICDLTGRERKIEVQFHCNPQSSDKIDMIKEVSTCSYLMVINTPRLCNDVAFMPSQENKAHTISCRHILAESEIPAYTQAKMLEAEQAERAAAEAKALAEQKKKDAEKAGKAGKAGANGLADQPESIVQALLNVFDSHHPNRPGRKLPLEPVNIGGTQLGAQQLVGSDGKTIEKGIVAGGKGKEIYVGTVASSDGKQMSKDEMRRLDIHDPREVEEYKKELQKISGGKPWKLELVDTPAGRQFRGVIEDEAARAEREQRRKAKQGEAGKAKKPTDGGAGADGGVAGGEGAGDHEGSEETYKKDEL